MTSSPRLLRFFRFSLRSYMLLVGVLGIAIFPVAKEWRTVSAEQAALKRLPVSAGAQWKDHPSPITRAIARLIRRFEPNAGKRVQVLHLSYPGKIHPQSLAAFRWLERIEMTNNVEFVRPTDDVAIPSVRTLVVRHASLGNGGLRDLNFLEHFPNLRSLALRQVTVTPKALTRIEESQIESLELYGCRDYEQLRQMDLSEMKQLRRLKIDNSLARNCPQLINSAAELQVLMIAMWGSDQGPVFPDLDQPDLRVAELCSMNLHEQDLRALARHSRLTDLMLACNAPQDPALEHLQDLPLESLAIRKYQLSDRAIDQIARMSTLRRLELTIGVMNYKKLSSLNALPQLEELKLPQAAAIKTPVDLRAKVRIMP